MPIDVSKAAPFRQALAALKKRQPVAVDWSAADWRDFVPPYFRQDAFFSAHTASARMLNSYKTFLDDFLSKAVETVTLPDGTTTIALKAQGRAGFVRDAKEMFGGGPDEGGGRITDLLSTTRTQLIFETNLRMSFGRAQFEEGNLPEILDYFPGQRFIRVGFVQEPRPLHEEHRDEIHLKDDLAFWLAMNSPDIGGFDLPYEPFGYNSQMGTEDVDRATCVELGLLDADTQIAPPDVQLREYQKSGIEGMDEGIKQVLLSALGDGARVSGDEVQL
jgi:hypothetical protein